MTVKFPDYKKKQRIKGKKKCSTFALPTPKPSAEVYVFVCVQGMKFKRKNKLASPFADICIVQGLLKLGYLSSALFLWSSGALTCI